MNRKTIIEELQKSRTLKRWEIRDLNLSALDLSGVDFTGTLFSGCTLRNSRLDGSCLNETSFIDCHLEGATFQSATLRGASFQGCRGLEKENKLFLVEGGANVVDPKRNPLSYLLIAFVVAAVLLVAYLIVFVKPGTHQGSDQAAASPALVDAKIIFTEGAAKLAMLDYNAALPLLKSASDLLPENIDVGFQYARCLLEMGKYSEARTQFEKIVARNPSQEIDVPAHQFLAEAYQRDGKADFADNVYEAMLGKYADSPAVVYGLYLNHANLRWKTKDNEGALKLFDELLRIGTPEQHSGVYLMRGLVYKGMDRRDLARQEFERVVREFDRRSPTVLDASVQLAMSDLEDGQAEKAVSSLKALLKEGADAGQVFGVLLKIYGQWTDKGDKAAAVKLLESMEKMFDDLPEYLATIHVEYGKLALEKKDPTTARAHFERVIALSHDPAQSAWAAESIEEIKRASTPPAP